MTLPALEFELPRRNILFHKDTEMPDFSIMGFTGNPNNAFPSSTPGEELIFYSPSGTMYLDKGVNPHQGWMKVQDTAGGLWIRCPAESSGGVGAVRRTKISIIEKVASGAQFYLNSNSTYYIKEYDDGYLEETAQKFIDNQSIQFHLNGATLVKGETVMWASNVSFYFGFDVDPEDWILVIT